MEVFFCMLKTPQQIGNIRPIDTLISGYDILISGYGTLKSGYGTLKSGYGSLKSGYGTLKPGYWYGSYVLGVICKEVALAVLHCVDQ